MMETWYYSMASALLVSAISVVGAIGLFLGEQSLRQAITVLVGLAVGVLLGDAFVHLLPEAMELTEAPRRVSVLVLAGVLAFFSMEKIVKWRHSHSLTLSNDQDVRSYTRMCLIGDGLHNFIDGAIIASSFLVNPTVGIATTIAIIAHEIPQEIGDVAILVHGGYSTRRAVWLNFLCALTVIPGVVCTLLFSLQFAGSVPYLLPIAAGGFIYIAASDLIPQLHEELPPRTQLAQVMAIASGIFFITSATMLEEKLDPKTRASVPPIAAIGISDPSPGQGLGATKMGYSHHGKAL
jgi:zinc and cadmium transporter